MRALPVALLSAVLLTLSAPAKAAGASDSPTEDLALTVTSSGVPTPSPESISFVAVGLLAASGVVRRHRSPGRIVHRR